ncbi:excinuclease ABC subunit UvrB [Candidatus Sumerlaeota bacterium]|nr:excinuclease ABC subunit UvrB [Candidatus Sumerlaeota bacterium]
MSVREESDEIGEFLKRKREGTFNLVSEFKPSGDQPEAIDQLIRGVENGLPAQVLLGVTGSGKTFTMAHVIHRLNRAALVLAPNKTLAAQLYREFKELFPDNAVEYFVSYYDYYQPEAYIPSSDTYIEKDSSINDELDKLRLSATRSLLERNDVIVVASVSCIYGIGSPSDYFNLVEYLEPGQRTKREDLLRRFVELQYARSDNDFYRGTFRVRGDQVDIFPAYEERRALRVEFFGDEIDALTEIDPLTGERVRKVRRAAIYPASVYATTRERLNAAMKLIGAELAARLVELENAGKSLEYTRLKQRTEYDLELMKEMGVCPGIENYSRHLAGRNAGDPPYTLIDYFPDNFLLFVDESHIAIPQVRAMFHGDRSRKSSLVEYGFRLPSALDNRPLQFDEFEKKINQVVFVSATPDQYELERSGGAIAEQIIRPTGLLDPRIIVRPVASQVQDLLEEIRQRITSGQRVLVTTLTKRFAEELTEYYGDIGIRVRYLHSDVDVLDRVQIIKELREGKFDVLIGINLLREGLDIPECSLVAILDADKEGYLRSTRSLIQTVGRAARNLDGMVIMYADAVTKSMQSCIDETNRRRAKQEEYNTANGITPRGVQKKIATIIETSYDYEESALLSVAEDETPYLTKAQVDRRREQLQKEMKEAARALDFERAAQLRDEILKLDKRVLPV